MALEVVVKDLNLESVSAYRVSGANRCVVHGVGSDGKPFEYNISYDGAISLSFIARSPYNQVTAREMPGLSANLCPPQLLCMNKGIAALTPRALNAKYDLAREPEEPLYFRGVDPSKTTT